MKFTEVKDLSAVELKKKIKSLEADMFKARMKNTVGQLQNPVQIRFMRKDIARLRTSLSQKVAR